MQASFSDLEYAAKKRITRRDRSLSEVDAVSTWSALVAEIEPLYPEGDGRGRPPNGVQRMQRMLGIYIAQRCFGLSDEGIENPIYDSQAIRGFIGIDQNQETAPNATTLLKFHGLLKEKNLTERIFTTNKALLAAKGLLLSGKVLPWMRRSSTRVARRKPETVSASLKLFRHKFLSSSLFF